MKDKRNAFLVEPDDFEAVAQHLVEIFSNRELWERTSHAAATGVSDEFGTVSNALCWYYLAIKLTAARAGDTKFPGTVVGSTIWRAQKRDVHTRQKRIASHGDLRRIKRRSGMSRE